MIKKSPLLSVNSRGAGKTAESLLDELQLHQMELETQNAELKRAQVELETERARYFDLYNLAPVGYCTVSKGGSILEANLAAATLLAVTPGGLLNQAISQYILEKDQGLYYQEKKRLFATGAPQSCELRMLRQDRTSFWAHLEISVASDKDGAPASRIAFNDVPERQVALDALRESEARYSSLYSHSALGVFRSTLEGRFIDLNPALTKLLGYDSPEEAMSDITNIAQQIYAEPHQRDADKAEVLSSGESLIKENLYRRRDGSLWYGMLRLRLNSDRPDQQYLEGFVEDITLRKQVEEKLQESEARLREVLENSLDASYKRTLLTDTYDYISPNFHLIAGYTPEEMKALSMEKVITLIHPEDLPEVEQVLVESMSDSSGMPYRLEYRFRDKEGRYRWLLDQFVVMVDAGGRPLARIGSVSDNRERKQIEEIQKLMAQSGSGLQKKTFFNTLARHLAETLQMDFICIDRLEGDGQTARTLSVWSDGTLQDNVSYALKDTPCYEVVGKLVCCYPADVCRFFPNDQLLRELRAESYTGVTLFGNTGLPIGLISVIGRKPLEDCQLVEAILKVVALRAAGELERLDVDEALRESEKKYRLIFENAGDAIFICDEQGRMLAVNPVAAKKLGYTHDELMSLPLSRIDTPEHAQFVSDRWVRLEEHGNFVFESMHQRKDGACFPTEVNARLITWDGQQAVMSICRDMTERRQRETYKDMGREILQILNRAGELQDVIKGALVALQKFTGVEAVGIRLQDGDDFPYAVQRGFSKDFLLTENSLIARTADGLPCRDDDGRVRLECTCGLVLAGKTDPDNPLFTPGGSCWTNNSITLPHIPEDADLRLHPRNQCIHQGYASVILTPIRDTGRIVGLIQLCDRRTGCFTLDMVETFEGIASHIGTALMRSRMTAALKGSVAEKEVLLKEVHHRVKNNLAAIMGLVDMQGQDLADDSGRTSLAELSTRIKSMALVHEQLYQSENLSKVNFQEYLETLVAHLRWAYEKSCGVQVSIAAVGVTMGLDYAVPCGLLITELVTNTFKYAFPDGQARPGATSCQLAVSVSWDGAAYSLTVADNGVGLTAGFGWTTTKTLGLRLVGMLGQHQLQGTIDLDLSGGTMFRLRFAPKSKG